MQAITRKSVESLSPGQLASLSRTTRWRAEKRGWVALNYHQRFTNVEARAISPEEFEALSAEIYRQARCIASRALAAGWPFPSWMERDDLIQECVIEVWRVSQKPEFFDPAWRGSVMKLHLKRLRQGCRFDRDAQNQVEAESLH